MLDRTPRPRTRTGLLRDLADTLLPGTFLPGTLLLGVALLFGCGTEAPMSPGAGQESAVSQPPAADVLGDIDVANASSRTIGAINGLIESGHENSAIVVTRTVSSRRGGVVQAGPYRLTFPPDALAQDTEITVVQNLSDDHSLTFELLPHGIEFQRPVTLRVWLADKQLSPTDDVRQYWFDDVTGEYVDMGGVWSFPFLTTEISHFSVWKSGRVGW